MREYKFRAWHKTLKVMLNVYVIDQTRHAGLEYCGKCKGYYGENIQIEFTYDEVEWVQFTGLSDKNGKEIYEGDKCKIAGSSGVIEYSETGCKYYLNGEGFSTQLGSWNPADIEVIGNIYENKNL